MLEIVLLKKKRPQENMLRQPPSVPSWSPHRRDGTYDEEKADRLKKIADERLAELKAMREERRQAMVTDKGKGKGKGKGLKVKNGKNLKVNKDLKSKTDGKGKTDVKGKGKGLKGKTDLKGKETDLK